MPSPSVKKRFRAGKWYAQYNVQHYHHLEAHNDTGQSQASWLISTSAGLAALLKQTGQENWFIPPVSNALVTPLICFRLSFTQHIFSGKERREKQRALLVQITGMTESTGRCAKSHLRAVSHTK